MCVCMCVTWGTHMPLSAWAQLCSLLQPLRVSQGSTQVVRSVQQALYLVGHFTTLPPSVNRAWVCHFNYLPRCCSIMSQTHIVIKHILELFHLAAMQMILLVPPTPPSLQPLTWISKSSWLFLSNAIANITLSGSGSLKAIGNELHSVCEQSPSFS